MRKEQKCFQCKRVYLGARCSSRQRRSRYMGQFWILSKPPERRSSISAWKPTRMKAGQGVKHSWRRRCRQGFRSSHVAGVGAKTRNFYLLGRPGRVRNECLQAVGPTEGPQTFHLIGAPSRPAPAGPEVCLKPNPHLPASCGSCKAYFRQRPTAVYDDDGWWQQLRGHARLMHACAAGPSSREDSRLVNHGRTCPCRVRLLPAFQGPQAIPKFHPQRKCVTTD